MEGHAPSCLLLPFQRRRNGDLHRAVHGPQVRFVNRGGFSKKLAAAFRTHSVIPAHSPREPWCGSPSAIGYGAGSRSLWTSQPHSRLSERTFCRTAVRLDGAWQARNPFFAADRPGTPYPPDARRGGPNARLYLGNPRFQRCWGRLCLRSSMKSATCSPTGMRGHKSKITNASRSSRSGCGRRTNTPSTYLGSIPVLAGFRLYLTVDVHVFAQYIGGEAKENHGVIKRQFQCPEIHRLVAW